MKLRERACLEVATPFERGEDVAESSAVGKLWRLHHVEESVAEDLLHRSGVYFAQQPAEPLHHGVRHRAKRCGFSERTGARLKLIGGAADQRCVEPVRDAGELLLINALWQRKKCGANTAIAHHRNEGGEAISAAHQVNVSKAC